MLVLKGAGRMLKEFQYVKAEAADFECYIDCAKLMDLQQYLESFGFREIRRKTFASHQNGGTCWDIVWGRPTKGLFEDAWRWFTAGAVPISN